MSEEDNAPVDPIDPLTIGEIITLIEASELSGISYSYLRDIAKSGRLRTKKSGNIWLTTLACVEEYKKSRHRGKRTDLGK